MLTHTLSYFLQAILFIKNDYFKGNISYVILKANGCHGKQNVNTFFLNSKQGYADMIPSRGPHIPDRPVKCWLVKWTLLAHCPFGAEGAEGQSNSKIYSHHMPSFIKERQYPMWHCPGLRLSITIDRASTNNTPQYRVYYAKKFLSWHVCIG